MTPSLPAEQRTLRPGRRLSVALHEGASAADTAVLFIHGSGGRKDQWALLWNALAARSDGPALIAWDAPGHGASPVMRRPGAYATEAWLEDALALIEAHAGDRKLVIVGHSYGTVVALSLLLRLKQAGAGSRVVGAVLYGPPPPGFRPAGPIVELPLRTLNRMRPELEHSFRAFAWSPEADPALIASEEAHARRNRLYMMQRLMREAQAPDPGALGGLDLPIRLVAGADDKLTPPAGAEALAALLPQADLTIIPGCGHQIMLERPEQALTSLERFVSPGAAADGAR